MNHFFAILLISLITLISKAQDINFCGEEVSVDNRIVIKKLSTIIYDNMRHNNRLIYFRDKANLYFPEIEPILIEEDVPLDLRFIPLIESAFNKNAVSSKQAVGYWQFLDGTAKDYGLRVDRYVDERRNLKKATIAACKYLKSLYSELGSWTLAAAAYNFGLGNIKKSLGNQKTVNYYDLKLNSETGMYVYKILALKELFVYPESYSSFLNPKTFQFLVNSAPKEKLKDEIVDYQFKVKKSDIAKFEIINSYDFQEDSIVVANLTKREIISLKGYFLNTVEIKEGDELQVGLVNKSNLHRKILVAKVDKIHFDTNTLSISVPFELENGEKTTLKIIDLDDNPLKFSLKKINKKIILTEGYVVKLTELRKADQIVP